MFHTDCFFTIGKSHHICQDYAEAFENGVILSDGCSSAPETHIGAILLTKAAKKFINSTDSIEVINNNIIQTAQTYAKLMDLNLDSLCATLLTARVFENRFYYNVVGDGAVALHHKNTGNWILTVHEYPSGAPFYLRYILDPAVRENYLNRFGFKCIKRIYNEDFEDDITYSTPRPETIEATSVPISEFDAIMLFSDGVNSFHKTVKTDTTISTVPVSPLNIMDEFLKFKNYTGKFVQRRCIAALKELTNQGYHHSDDFSMAGIVLGDVK